MGTRRTQPRSGGRRPSSSGSAPRRSATGSIARTLAAACSRDARTGLPAARPSPSRPRSVAPCPLGPRALAAHGLRAAPPRARIPRGGWRCAEARPPSPRARGLPERLQGPCRCSRAAARSHGPRTPPGRRPEPRRRGALAASRPCSAHRPAMRIGPQDGCWSATACRLRPPRHAPRSPWGWRLGAAIRPQVPRRPPAHRPRLVRHLPVSHPSSQPSVTNCLHASRRMPCSACLVPRSPPSIQMLPTQGVNSPHSVPAGSATTVCPLDLQRLCVRRCRAAHPAARSSQSRRSSMTARPLDRQTPTAKSRWLALLLLGRPKGRRLAMEVCLADPHVLTAHSPHPAHMAMRS
mmetsp:Transcript_23114/g.72762  ORF Transcript_23114/g.72762 Transcript_23114/m.72762 type:complete len:350 (+) Transcript_23114:231-1280(+)